MDIKKLWLIVTAVLAVLAVLFLILWQVSDGKLKQLRSESAENTAASLKAYMKDASEASYLDSVIGMRTFLDSWEKLGGKGKAFDSGLVIYDAMRRDPRLIYEYTEELIPVMEKLSSNIKDREALMELERLGSILKQ